MVGRPVRCLLDVLGPAGCRSLARQRPSLLGGHALRPSYPATRPSNSLVHAGIPMFIPASSPELLNNARPPCVVLAYVHNAGMTNWMLARKRPTCALAGG